TQVVGFEFHPVEEGHTGYEEHDSDEDEAECQKSRAYGKQEFDRQSHWLPLAANTLQRETLHTLPRVSHNHSALLGRVDSFRGSRVTQTDPKLSPACSTWRVTNRPVPAFDGETAKIQPKTDLAGVGAGLRKFLKHGAHQVRRDSRTFVIDRHQHAG